MTSTATCKSCGASIVWAKAVSGKNVPLDAEPRDDGTIAIDAKGRAMVLVKDMMLDPNWPRERYVSHFATCPNAETWRRR